MTVATPVGGFTPTPLPIHLSHSQASTLSDCGERYRLERYYRVPQRPGWALIGGKATHVGTELLDYASLSWETLADHLGLVFGPGPATTPHTGGPLDMAQSMEKLVLQSGRGRQRSPEEIEREVTRNLGIYLAVIDVRPEEELAGFGSDGLEIEAGAINIKDHPVPASVQRLGELLLEAEIDAARHDHPEFPNEADWKAFGRVSVKYPDKEARKWWTDHVPLFLWRWIHWRTFSGFQVAMLDMAVPAIETDVSSTFGPVTVKGYLDRVMLNRSGQPVVVDIKSNANEPSDDEQLGQYAVQLQQMGFPKPMLGQYWMARTGRMGSPRDLSGYSEDSFAYKYRVAKRRRDEGEWVANTKSTICSFCGVKDYCYAQKGKYSNQVPRPWETGAPLIRES